VFLTHSRTHLPRRADKSLLGSLVGSYCTFQARTEDFIWGARMHG